MQSDTVEEAGEEGGGGEGEGEAEEGEGEEKKSEGDLQLLVGEFVAAPPR